MFYTNQPELRWLLNDLIAEAPSTRLDMANRNSRGEDAGAGQLWVGCGAWGESSARSVLAADQQQRGTSWGWWVEKILGRLTCVLSKLPQRGNSMYFTRSTPSLQTSSTTALDKGSCKKYVKNVKRMYFLTASPDCLLQRIKKTEAHGASFSTTQDFLNKARKDPYVV